MLMLKIVRKAEPYLEDLCGKLSYDVSDLYRPVSKKQKKISYMDHDYFQCQKYLRDFDHDCAFAKCKVEGDEDYYSSPSDESCGPDSDGFYSLGHEAGRCPVKMDFSKGDQKNQFRVLMYDFVRSHILQNPYLLILHTF